MVFSAIQFFVTTLLAIVCAQSIEVTQGNVPVLALAIPAYGSTRALAHLASFCWQACAIWFYTAVSSNCTLGINVDSIPSTHGRLLKAQ